MLVLNDLHFGVNRQAGTTPMTQAMLRQYLRTETRQLLESRNDNVLTINGDLFDGFTVDIAEVVEVFQILADWLNDKPYRTLNLMAGNHDWNPRGDKMSSFHFLCRFLKFQFPNDVRVFDKGFEHVYLNVWCIPHQPNQSLFDLELKKAIDNPSSGDYLLLHCNYKNTFAEHSDHSLNISAEQVDALMVAGWNLVFGHEHQGYTLRGGRVIVVGNQFPSSCSDCIGETEKYALVIRSEGHEAVCTWAKDGEYIELPWTEAAAYSGPEKFIRVVGECTAEQSADMIAAVAKLRQTHDAFVVSNSVRVAGMVEMEALTSMTVENVSRFSVMDALLETLDDGEQIKIKELIS